MDKLLTASLPSRLQCKCEEACCVRCPLTHFLPRRAPQTSSSELTCVMGTDSTGDMWPFLTWCWHPGAPEQSASNHRFQRSLVPGNPLRSLVFEANWRRRGLLHAYYKFRQTIARLQRPTKLPHKERSVVRFESQEPAPCLSRTETQSKCSQNRIPFKFIFLMKV